MWFKKAAEVGNIRSQWRLGVAYDKGELGLVTGALKWLQAAEGGAEAAAEGTGEAKSPGAACSFLCFI